MKKKNYGQFSHSDSGSQYTRPPCRPVFKCHKNYGTDLRGFESGGYSPLCAKSDNHLSGTADHYRSCGIFHYFRKKAPTPVTAPIVRITYFSMLGAAAFASVLGYLIIPKLPVSTDSLSFRFLPDTLFELPIPAPVSALSALVLAILLALGACWTNAVRTKELLQEFRESPFPDVQDSSSTAACLYRAFYVHWLIRIFHQVSATVASGTYYYNSGLYGLGVGSVSYCRILCRRKGMGNFEKLYTDL